MPPALLRPMLAMAGALLVGAVLVATAGHDPLQAGEAIAIGAFGNAYRLAVTLNRAAPCLLAATGIALCCRAGLVNLGAEGQIALGGLAVALVVLPVEQPGRLWQLAALAAAVLLGAGLSALAGLLRAWRGVPEALGTLLLNAIALLLVAAALRGPLGDGLAGLPQTPLFEPGAALPKLDAATDLHAGLAMAVVAAVAAQLLVSASLAGFHWRLLAHSPRLLRHAGLSPGAQQVAVMALGGALAGLAGGVEILGVQNRLAEGFSSGFGFTGLAVAIVAAASPLAAIPIAILFAALETGALEAQQRSGLPASLAPVMQAVALLLMLPRQGMGR